MDPRLSSAAATGDITALRELLREDPLVLHNVTLNSANTPLHIAASLNHADFVKEVLRHNPEWAHEPNQQGLTPIHLASAKGHLQIVKNLLHFDPMLAFIKDQDGKIPLHTAACRGKSLVLTELFSFSPVSGKELTPCGETVLHLAVKSYQYQALVSLIQLIKQFRIDKQIFNFKDDEGNTVLHHACKRKNQKMVKLLLTETAVDVNAVNAEGLTAIDIVLTYTAQPNERKIVEMLLRAGGKGKRRAVQRHSQMGTDVQRSEKLISSLKNGILLMAVMFATLTFEMALNPPGGLWQEWPSSNTSTDTVIPAPSRSTAGDPTTETRGKFFSPTNLVFFRVKYWNTSYIPSITEAHAHHPGKSINRELTRGLFVAFLLYDAVCFFTSLAMIVMVATIETFNWDANVAAVVLFGLTANLLWFAGLTFRTGVALVTDNSVSLWIVYAGLYNLGVAFVFWGLLFLVARILWSYLKKRS